MSSDLNKLNWKQQISALIQLAKADNYFAGLEKLHILYLARIHDISEEEVREIENNPLPLPDFHLLSEDEKFDFLFNIVQLMKIDSEVYLSEISYCERVAKELGFDQSVIEELSSKVYSDPSITANVEELKKVVLQMDHYPTTPGDVVNED